MKIVFVKIILLKNVTNQRKNNIKVFLNKSKFNLKRIKSYWFFIFIIFVYTKSLSYKSQQFIFQCFCNQLAFTYEPIFTQLTIRYYL